LVFQCEDRDRTRAKEGKEDAGRSGGDMISTLVGLGEGERFGGNGKVKS
jgi:hypothetical protein